MRARDFFKKGSNHDKFLYRPEPKLQKYYYFAYGRNADLTVMHSHGFCHLIGPAILSGYHLTFRRFANIEEGGKCYGVLWEIDQQTLKMLDKQEGFPFCYGRQFVKVKGIDGETYNAYAYIMSDSYAKIGTGIAPSKSYIKHLVRGYERFGCPLNQIVKALKDSEVRVEVDNVALWKKTNTDTKLNKAPFYEVPPYPEAPLETSWNEARETAYKFINEVAHHAI